MDIDDLDLNFLIEEKDVHYPGPNHGVPMVPLKPQDGLGGDDGDGRLTGNDTFDNIIAGGTALGLLLWFIITGAGSG